MSYNLSHCNDFPLRICPTCKKEFYATQMWAYYINERINGKTYCSWGCLQAAREKKKNTQRVGKEKREIILSLAREGYPDEEIGRMTGISGQLVRYYRLKEEKETGEEVRCKQRRGRKVGS